MTEQPTVKPEEHDVYCAEMFCGNCFKLVRSWFPMGKPKQDFYCTNCGCLVRVNGRGLL